MKPPVLSLGSGVLRGVLPSLGLVGTLALGHLSCTQPPRRSDPTQVAPPNDNGIGTYVGAYQAAQIVGERLGVRGWAEGQGAGGVYEGIFGAKALSGSDLNQINKQLAAISGKLTEIHNQLETLQASMEESFRALEQILKALENVDEKLLIYGAITRRGKTWDDAQDYLNTMQNDYNAISKLDIKDDDKAFWSQLAYEQAIAIVKDASPLKVHLANIHSSLVGGQNESEPGLLMAYARAAAYCVKTDQEALLAARFLEQKMVDGVTLHLYGHTLLVDAYRTALKGDRNMQSQLDIQLSIHRDQVREILDEYIRAIERLAASRVDTATVGEFNAYIGQAATPVLDPITHRPTGILQEADRSHLALWWTLPSSAEEEVQFAALKKKNVLFARVINYTDYSTPWHPASSFPAGIETQPLGLAFKERRTGIEWSPSRTPQIRRGLAKDRNGNAYPYQILYARLEGLDDGIGHEFSLTGTVVSEADKTHILRLDDHLGIPSLSIGTVYGHGPRLRWRSASMEWDGKIDSGTPNSIFFNLSVIPATEATGPRVFVSHHHQNDHDGNSGGGSAWHPWAQLTLLNGTDGTLLHRWRELPGVAGGPQALRFLGPGVDAGGRAYLAAVTAATGDVNILRYTDSTLAVLDENKVVGRNFAWSAFHAAPGQVQPGAPGIYGMLVEPSGAVTLTGWIAGDGAGKRNPRVAYWVRYLGKDPVQYYDTPGGWCVFDTDYYPWPWIRDIGLAWDPLTGTFLDGIYCWFGEPERQTHVRVHKWGDNGELLQADTALWGDKYPLSQATPGGIQIDPAGFIYLLKRDGAATASVRMLGRRVFHGDQAGTMSEGSSAEFPVLSSKFGVGCDQVALGYEEAGMSLGVDPRTKTLFTAREVFNPPPPNFSQWTPAELRIVATTWQVGRLDLGPM